MKWRLLLLLILLLPVVSTSQFKPTKGAIASISYDPEKAGIFKHLDQMKVVYVVNFWNKRQGTRLALRENVLRPDSTRVKTAALTKTDISWNADLEIPPNGAVLSYYITDGEVIDDNDGRTFVAYVYNSEGAPVANAHYFMVPFLQMEGESLPELVRESEREIMHYPENFRAYSQYFALYMEQEKGSQRGQRRIINRLNELEEKYGDQPECLNLIARTYYFILRDLENALIYKEKIDQRDRWPEVETIFDSRSHTEKKQQRAKDMEDARAAIINTPAPAISFIADGNSRIAVQDFKSKVVVLVFWATSSELSKKLFSPLSEILKKHKSKGLEVLAVNTGEDKKLVKDYVSKAKLSFNFAFNNGSAFKLYGVDGIPQTYVIDRDGVVRNVIVGYSPAQIPELEKAIVEQL
jgi:peroxiredoxin